MWHRARSCVAGSATILPGWQEFKSRYSSELDGNHEAWQPLLLAARQGDITLIYSARDVEHNNAVVLKAYLEKIIG